MSEAPVKIFPFGGRKVEALASPLPFLPDPFASVRRAGGQQQRERAEQ